MRRQGRPPTLRGSGRVGLKAYRLAHFDGAPGDEMIDLAVVAAADADGLETIEATRAIQLAASAGMETRTRAAHDWRLPGVGTAVTLAVQARSPKAR